ncbi:MAG: hypothetical protein CTR53_03465 [Ferrovibrio sp.]|nr:MAG: hypothetical protein CTR53_03465 [Ferrovibrio sp.]
MASANGGNILIPPVFAMLLRRPLRACSAAVFATFLAFGAGGHAHAQNQSLATPSARPANPFGVSGVSVDASADSAAAARPIAVADGQRRAFSTLLRRLTLPDDHGRLPRPSEALLNEVVAGFGIDEERTSATRYIGKISVQFRADAIRRLLQDNRLPYSETTSRPVLLVPVWQSNEGARIWEADNPWREAWLRRPDTEGGLVPLSVAPPMPNGGPSLERLFGNPDELRNLMRQGGFDDALLVVATLQSAEVGNTRVEIQIQHQGQAAFLGTTEAFTATGGTQEETLLSAAIEIGRRIETRWKYASVIDLEKQGQLSVAAAFNGLAEWTRLRAALAGVPIVRKVDVLQVSHRDAQILLDYYGEPGQLSIALAQRNVVLQQRDGFWEMRSRQP